MCSCVCVDILMTLFLPHAHFYIICHVHAVRTGCMPTDRSSGNLHKWSFFCNGRDSHPTRVVHKKTADFRSPTMFFHVVATRKLWSHFTKTPCSQDPGKCMEPSCDLLHPPVCQKYKSESWCKYGDKCDTLRLVGSPVKSQRKSGGKGSVALFGLCVPRFLQKVYSAGKLNIRDQITQSSSRRPWCVTQKLEERRVHRSKIRGKNAKCNPQARAPVEKHGNLAKDVSKLKKKESQDTFYSPDEVWVMPAPSSTNPEALKLLCIC